MSTFGARLQAAVAARGPLCVGVDPHEHLLREWGLDATAHGAREFGLRVIEACVDRVAVIKPQVSFFERYGSAGIAALEEVLSSARAAGLLTIADAKRGDIGSTMDAYARAWLSQGSPLEADALTVNPYLGVGALDSTMRFAMEVGKGLFVLAATSNPEAGTLQRARRDDGLTVASGIISEVSDFAAGHTAVSTWSSIGFVIGATVEVNAFDLPETIEPIAPILSPGFGHQGAGLTEVESRFGPLAKSVLVSESRGILAAGPGGLVRAIDERRVILQETRSA
ncbi:orotidine-5'-phosphate decarboxylase [Microbacterium sp. C7(2022)]|uniref:orotidine-5'-phosphate decarboxylase n=1 Tax=Microbacterium sp. C7(2022) TaxID=2992759 RepID=UPI00237B8C4E|nr:orotidine-5'-phosphate decarboxylase [Microbacterium sp. C7(2022)]MDE0545554.1 orotidine-5'-phosphate decarboxylase [Microbacterium sp. C7(2022)]